MLHPLSARLRPAYFFLCSLLVIAMPVNSHDIQSPQSAQKMLQAADRFLSSLSKDQWRQAVFEFDDAERFDWNYVPTSREGISFKDMNDDQKQLAHDFLKNGLSELGYQKSTTIILLEAVLREIETFNWVGRDPEKYYLTFFGEPSEAGTWGWRFEGHHLSINVTIVDGRSFATTPTFLGANPAEVREGPHKGTRALAREEDLARELVTSLAEEQLQVALFRKSAFRDIVTGSYEKVSPPEPAGIAVADLSADQRRLLFDLIQEYAATMPEDIATQRLERIANSNLDEIRFGWAGSLNKGEPHYYRIQGPTFIIEYDNTQDGANHIHSVWREFDGDFGRDLLGEHLRNDHRQQ